MIWGFFYWNLRKTLYRRGMTRRCPCQHPSDSGRAMETACIAVLHWNRPARFRAVCPLLRRAQNGEWRCSVNRAEVRPFWSRAAAFYVGSVVSAYLVVTLSVFLFLRAGAGYGVSYAGVLWPPAWSKFNSIRTEFFLEKYRTASRAGDIPTSIAALSTAYNFDPHNYDAGAQLAQLWQVTQTGRSNQIFEQLMHEHPDRAPQTAQLWFRALLARGDFHGVEQLAIERVNADSENAQAWLSAFFFANQRTRDARARLTLAASAELSRTGRFVIRLMDDLETLPVDQRKARLVTAAAEAGDSLAFYHVCRELIARGFAAEAVDWLERRGDILSPRDMLPLRLDAQASLGWDTTLRSEVQGLLISAPEPAIVTLLSAHLIRRPNAGVRSLLFERLEQSPLPLAQANYPAYLSLFCAAAAGHDQERLRWVSARLKTILRGDVRAIDAVGAALTDGTRSKRVENYLPALQPLPLEISYAMFERYAPLP